MNLSIPESEPTVLQLSEDCTITLHEDSLTLHDPTLKSTLEVQRNEANGRIERINLDKASPSFYMHVPKSRKFKLSQTDALKFTEWLGPETAVEAMHQLRRALAYTLPMGIIYIIIATTSLWWWFMGAVLIFNGLMYKFRPRIWLFLSDAGFWLLLLLVQIVSLKNGFSWFTIFLVFIITIALCRSLFLFNRFKKYVQFAA